MAIVGVVLLGLLAWATRREGPLADHFVWIWLGYVAVMTAYGLLTRDWPLVGVQLFASLLLLGAWCALKNEAARDELRRDQGGTGTRE